MKPKAILSERDEDLLMFLWRWKLATTRNLALAFYAGKSFRAAYIRLWRLERAGWLSSFTAPNGRDHFWTLTDSAFTQIVRPKLSGLIQNGYKSEAMDHDFLVNAIHLGKWVMGMPENVSLFTEQELRRLDPELYPEWVPQSQIHRPDGYTLIADGQESRFMAIEVELSQKKLEIYENVARFYFEDTRVTDVVWVVERQAQARSIKSRIDATIGNQRPNHSFILLDDLRKHHWLATIGLGNHNGLTFENVIGIRPENRRNHDSKIAFFDTRKSLRESSKTINSKARVLVNREALLASSQKIKKEYSK